MPKSVTRRQLIAGTAPLVAAAPVVAKLAWPTSAGAERLASHEGHDHPRLGHAAGETDRLIVHGAHMLAGGLWLGTLLSTVVVPSAAVRELRPALLKAFAPLAMIGFATLAATGAFAAWTYLGALSNLWTTTYGRLLGFKLLLVLDALTLGGLNWWRMHRLGLPPLTGAAIAEAVVAVGIVIVTGWLTETEHP